MPSIEDQITYWFAKEYEGKIMIIIECELWDWQNICTNSQTSQFFLVINFSVSANFKLFKLGWPPPSLKDNKYFLGEVGEGGAGGVQPDGEQALGGPDGPLLRAPHPEEGAAGAGVQTIEGGFRIN